MGFSHSVGAAIIFAGILLASFSLRSSTRTGYDDISESYDTMVDTGIDRLHTSIRVDHVYYNKSSDELVLVTYNDGKIVIDCDKLTLVGDGEIAPSDVKFTMYDWINYSRIFSAKDGYITFEDDNNNINIHFSDINSFDRFVSVLFSVRINPISFSVYDGFYFLGNRTSPYVIGRYHFNGELDWEVDVTPDFEPQPPVSIEVDREIYVSSDKNFVNAYDLNGNFLRTYQRAGLEPLDLCRANGNLYVARGDPGGKAVYIFDLLTTDYLGNLLENIDNPISVDADPSGNIYVLDAGDEDIDVFDSNHNYVDSIVSGLDNPIWLTISHYLTEDVIFVLLQGSNQAGVVEVFSLNGVLYDTIYIDEVYQGNEGRYALIEDCGALFLFSEDEDLVIELRIGYQILLTTGDGVKFFTYG